MLSPSMYPYPKAEEDQCPSLKTVRKRERQTDRQRQRILSYSDFLFYSDLHWNIGDPFTLGRATCFTQSIMLNINFIQKPPQRHAQNNVKSNTWAPHDLVRLAHKINCHELVTEVHSPHTNEQLHWNKIMMGKHHLK